MVYEEAGHLTIIKWRKDINHHVHHKLTEFKAFGDLHIHSDVFVGFYHGKEVYSLSVLEDDWSRCRLTYLVYLPRFHHAYSTLVHFFIEKARNLACF